MKRIIIIILTLLSMSNTFCQDDYFASYSSISKDFNIILLPQEESQFNLMIYAQSNTVKSLVDALGSTTGIIVDETNMNTLVSNLRYAKDKYEEWKKVAIENNVEEYEKELKVTPPKAAGFFEYDEDMHIDDSIEIGYLFRVRKDSETGMIEYDIVLKTNPYISSTSIFGVNDGCSIFFESLEEIDNFINLFEPDRINTYLQQINQKNDLFKD